MKIEVIERTAAIRVTEFSVNSKRNLRQDIGLVLAIDPDSFYLTQNGKLVQDDIFNPESPILVLPRVFGGKGGFGSMLRAIGAQIEKTTNRDACRDLSGRRLRDINEEQRLKRWFAKQGEREEEKKELRKQKLEKMRKICEGPPLPKIDDKDYNQQRADMAESVFDAVDKGFEASIKPSSSTASCTVTSSTITSHSDGSSDSHSETAEAGTQQKQEIPVLKKKFVGKIKKTIFDEDLDSDVSSSDSDDEVPAKKSKTA